MTKGGLECLGWLGVKKATGGSTTSATWKTFPGQDLGKESKGAEIHMEDWARFWPHKATNLISEKRSTRDEGVSRRQHYFLIPDLHWVCCGDRLNKECPKSLVQWGNLLSGWVFTTTSNTGEGTTTRNTMEKCVERRVCKYVTGHWQMMPWMCTVEKYNS